MDESHLAQCRREIDSIDEALVGLLARRFRICLEIARIKRGQGLSVMQPARVEQVKSHAAARAVSAGVDPSFARELWDRIILEACRLELEDETKGAAGIAEPPSGSTAPL